MVDVIIPVYLPMLQGLVGHVTVEGLWGEGRATPVRWGVSQRPPKTKWNPGARAARVIWED